MTCGNNCFGIFRWKSGSKMGDMQTNQRVTCANVEDIVVKKQLVTTQHPGKTTLTRFEGATSFIPRVTGSLDRMAYSLVSGIPIRVMKLNRKRSPRMINLERLTPKISIVEPSFI